MSRRSDAVDLARGLALIAMAAYHLVWDLTAFRFLPSHWPFSAPMHVASHAIGSAFLALVGLSLALAHRDQPHWRAFRRRFLVVTAAAALVTAASLVVEPEAPIYFGILQCIALASLAAAPLLVAPALVSVVVGAAAIIAPFILQSSSFDPPWLMWTGLAAREPVTVDWRPLLPWGGVVWLSFGLARSLPPTLFDVGVFRWRARGWPLRMFGALGRHSLGFYLLHQPALYGLVYLAALAFPPATTPVGPDAIAAKCRSVCVETGGQPELCEKACACVAEQEGQANSPNEQAIARACVGDSR